MFCNPSCTAKQVGILLLLVAGRAAPTTIVVVRTPVDVSIGADSLGTFYSGDGSQSDRSVCKIYSVGGAFLGVAGLDNDPVTKFSVPQTISEAIAGKVRFTETLSAAQHALIPKLESELQSLMRTRPQVVSDSLKSGGGVSIILLGIEDGVPVAIGQRFAVSTDGMSHVLPEKPVRCPGSDCVNGVYVFLLGESEIIKKATSSGGQSFNDSLALARRLVQLEIDAHVPGVGGPIDGLRVTAHGQEWVGRKPGCPISLMTPHN